MARPRKSRWVESEPNITFFKPKGIPLRGLEQVVISIDELEALRLADYLGLSQEEVAHGLNVSRPTVTRMLARAHQAIADALVHGKAIKIEGGDYTIAKDRFFCQDCAHTWISPAGENQPSSCPQCQGEAIQPLQRNTAP
ncbi:MAG: DUF134 domain-containing protein [Desulfobacteraceae bacterium]